MSSRGSSPGHLERGREAYERRDWAAAHLSLAAAERTSPLNVEDLDRLAWAAELSGDTEGFLKATERVYEVRLAEGATRPAARAAFWVGFRAMSLGEAGRANAWLGRAQRLVEGESSECAEQGYLLLPVAFRHQIADRLDVALAVAGEAAAIGDRVGDGDLSAFGRTIQGRALVRLGQIGRKARGRGHTMGVPLIRQKPKQLSAAGVTRAARTIGVRDGRPLLDDGRTLDVANVIWCTGFRGSFPWIDLPILDEKGSPRHEGGIVPEVPGLYFVGLHFLYALSSSMIHGVGRDADRISEAVAARAVPNRAASAQTGANEAAQPAA